MYDDKVREECGVFGIYNTNAEGDYLAKQTYLGLMALQHRGQEACGLAVNLNQEITFHKNMGLVDEVFSEEVLSRFKGHMAIGHCRYSTAGSKKDKDAAQPLVINYAKGQLAIAHNGNIRNVLELRAIYDEKGAIYRTHTDTEIIAYTIAKQRLSEGSIEKAVAKAMHILEGAYSLIMMSPSKMIVARDPFGFRPLCFGRKADGSVVFASETVALDAVDAVYERDVMPGEIITVQHGEIKSNTENCGQNGGKMCIFEYIYFARPDSTVQGQLVNDSRRSAGQLLAKASPVEADIVIGVPDSGIPSAIGYSEASGIPYVEGFGKNRYAGRTFIRPDQMSREAAVRLKLNPLRKYVEGKRVVLVDDSMVRGTTNKIIIKMLREAGVKEVHLRMSSPPYKYPCYYGTDVSTTSQLIATDHTIAEICEEIGADSLAFLQLSDLPHIIPDVKDIGYCEACFTGDYPI
ncbi:MAG: amidophosphoribosyltransferase [Defluviitaleaceae bacterium]|nr:amidophosphoribosyltransferase [Defluviitaleaceae bacterium]